MHPFEINNLDHVAINVKEMEVSIAWYQKVLGLKKYKPKKWGEFPVLMLAGKTGVAIFPAELINSQNNEAINCVNIDHFAFIVSNEHFTKAVQHYKNICLEFQIKDHSYFHSVYTNDPDGNTVELTTLMVEEKDFY